MLGIKADLFIISGHETVCSLTSVNTVQSEGGLRSVQHLVPSVYTVLILQS